MNSAFYKMQFRQSGSVPCGLCAEDSVIMSQNDNIIVDMLLFLSRVA